MLLCPIQNDIIIPSKIEDIAKQHSLSSKEEFHITIIGTQTGEELNKFSPLKKTSQIIKELAEKYQWRYSLESGYYLCSKIYPDGEKRQSIIQLITMKDIGDFYKKLNTCLGTHFDTPLAHITLYTSSTKKENNLRGIGIYSQKQFELLRPEKI